MPKHFTAHTISQPQANPSIMTSLSGLASSIEFSSLLYLVPVAVVLSHFVPWLFDPHGIRLYPGPLLAKFTDAWLGWVSREGHRSEVVHSLHKKYGKDNAPHPEKCGFA